jgi:Uma2 family endonuclease
MTTSLELAPLTQAKTGERRVVFYGLNWQRYQQILQALGNHRSARLTYDEGTLEITMPLEDHDYAVRLIELFIRVLVVEMSLKIKTMSSTTLDREDLDRGAEPDGGYYIQNQPLVKGRNVDLRQDPPPDLIVEVDITHSDINKFQLYAKMGVPEFWRYDGQALRVYQLQEGQYCEADLSPTFPTVPKTKLYEFLEQAREDEVEAELALREWVRSQVST